MQLSPNIRVKDFLKISKKRVPCKIMPYVGCGLYTTNGISDVIIDTDGQNYSFRYADPPTVDPSFYIKDEDGYIYLFTIYGSAGHEQFALADGLDPNGPQTAITPSDDLIGPPDAGNRLYEFSADGNFRIRNVTGFTFGGYHYLVGDNGVTGIETPEAASNPSAYLFSMGALFMFLGDIFYIYDTPNAVWRAPYVIADINRENAVLFLT